MRRSSKAAMGLKRMKKRFLALLCILFGHKPMRVVLGPYCVCRYCTRCNANDFGGIG